jgi:hypothetical protein
MSSFYRSGRPNGQAADKKKNTVKVPEHGKPRHKAKCGPTPSPRTPVHGFAAKLTIGTRQRIEHINVSNVYRTHMPRTFILSCRQNTHAETLLYHMTGDTRQSIFVVVRCRVSAHGRWAAMFRVTSVVYSDHMAEAWFPIVVMP